MPAEVDTVVFRDGREYTLVHVRTLTGRTHQVRVHMQSLGHPLVGDRKYGGPRGHEPWCPRMFLHSVKMRFRYRGALFDQSCPLPSDLRAVIDGMESEDQM